MLSFTSAHQILRSVLLLLIVIVLMFSIQCCSYEYRVGDLNCWGVPPNNNPNLYGIWSQYHTLNLGDSLLFLYPPSQDSVIQVTERAFAACSTARPILNLNDGNSVFNLTVPGRYYFISSTAGHCQKHQKLAIAIPYANGSYAFPPSSEDQYDLAPSYPLEFGPSVSVLAPSTNTASTAMLVGVSIVTGMVVAFALTILF